MASLVMAEIGEDENPESEIYADIFGLEYQLLERRRNFWEAAGRQNTIPPGERIEDHFVHNVRKIYNYPPPLAQIILGRFLSFVENIPDLSDATKDLIRALLFEHAFSAVR